MIGRVLSLSALGLVCCLILSLQAPQCLSNPLSTLPDVVERLWLNQIIEARPISLSMKDAAAQIPFMLGPPLFAVCILCWDIWKRRKWTAHILLLLLLLGALSLAIHQVRFLPFAYIFSILPLAGFISRLYVRNTRKASANDKNSNSPNLLYIGALALSIPIMWAMPGLLFIKESSVNSSKQITACYSDKVMKSLNSLPVGLIAATSNGSASILQFTEHRALSGNYHRNVEGISTQIKIATSEADKAIDLLKKYNVNYVHFCYPSNESKNLINENEKGFYSDLKAGKVPSGLELAVPKIENAVEISIYRVIE